MDKKYKLQNFTPTPFMTNTSNYDEAKADRAVNFIQSLKHTKGTWAGHNFELIAWQEELIRNIFGVVKDNGYRQFNTAFIELGKKNGKSELAAAIALYMLTADCEPGAEVYSCATDRQQASIVFNVAVDMVKQCPALKKRVKIIESQKRIVYHPTRSIYQVLSSEVASKYGYNVHACIFDELLGQPNRKLYDVMTKGAGAARKQPLNFVITTAGNDRNSICYEVHQKAMDILEGRKKDSTFYPVVYSAKDDDDWTSPEVWYKVNPSLGVTVDEEKLHLACESAKDNIAEELQFRQFFLCQWLNQTNRWMPIDRWDACDEYVLPDNLIGRECYGGLDLSTSQDLTAFVLVFPPKLKEQSINEICDKPRIHKKTIQIDESYIFIPYFWIPEDNIEKRVRRDHVPYDVWKRQGHIQTTEGNVIHYDFIEKFIENLSKKFNIKEIAFDRWGAVQITQRLEDMGFTVVPYGQGFKDMSPPTKELLKLVLEQKIIHNNNPVLRWNMENVYIKSDSAGNIKPDKEKSTERIDGAVATIMALDRAIRNEGQMQGSVYDQRGILVI